MARSRVRYWPGYGGWVRVARESRALTEKELADKAGWPVEKIRQIECNALPAITFADRDTLSTVLNFPPHFFERETPEDHDGMWICGEGVHPCSAPGGKGGICGYVADYLCDYPVGEGKTCDLCLCEDHAIEQGAEFQDMHFCPQHSLVDRGLVTTSKERG